MIDPYVFEKANGEYLLFFKQNGISVSRSTDLCDWEFIGYMDGGENVCVMEEEGRYRLIHSPKNGIGVKESDDLTNWKDIGVYTLEQEQWEWASGRLTAAFTMRAEAASAYRYIVFFHGSRADSTPETHGSASLAFAYTNDFKSYHF